MDTWRKYLKFGFAISAIIVGIIMNFIFGNNLNAPFGSAGNYLIVVGVIILAWTIIYLLFEKKDAIKVDERINYISAKATKIMYLILIIVIFVAMIYDMVAPIKIPYYIFLSTLLSFTALVYFITYKILEKYN